MATLFTTFVVLSTLLWSYHFFYIMLAGDGKKFAFFPTKMDSGKFAWLSFFHYECHGGGWGNSDTFYFWSVKEELEAQAQRQANQLRHNQAQNNRLKLVK